MATLRSLLVTLLPVGLSIYDHSPLIQSTGSLIKNTAPRQRSGCENGDNLCVPTSMCALNNQQIRGTEIECPPTWLCCRLPKTDIEILQKDKSFRRKQRLAAWSRERMTTKEEGKTFFEEMKKLQCKWEWFFGGCHNVCGGDTECVGVCTDCKTMVTKACNKDTHDSPDLEAPYSYSFVAEICHIAKSEKKCSSSFEERKEEDISVGFYCEKQCYVDYTSCGGKNFFSGGVSEVGSVNSCTDCDKDKSVCKEDEPYLHLLERLPKDKTHELHCQHHFCENVCKAKCNRCLQDKNRHQCFHNGECKKTDKGCGHLCAVVDDSGKHRGEIGKAIDLMNTYTTQLWSFSEWVIKYMQEEYATGETKFERDGKTCHIYYDKGDDVNDVKAIALMREPVNIQMNKWGYSQLRMRNNFKELKWTSDKGWAGSEYDEKVQVDDAKLPPNIAIGCDTPVVKPEDYQSKDHNEDRHKGAGRFVHILSVIWPVLDSKYSPDFPYFIDNGKVSDGTVFKEFYAKVLSKIVVAAETNKAKTVVMDGFGLEKALEVSEEGKKVMRKEFTEALHELDQVIGTAALKIYLPKNKFEFVFNQHQFKNIKETGSSCDFADPKQVMTDLTANFAKPSHPNKVLYVSSWDAYSFIGSGNAYDDSMNGKVGRATALAVLGWPHTNRHIKLQEVMMEGSKSEDAFHFHPDTQME